jgi:hypothetical protein
MLTRAEIKIKFFIKKNSVRSERDIKNPKEKLTKQNTV